MTRKRSGRPSLALCVIARDEEQFIADCLASAQSFVDEIIVVDSGSVDRTRDIAREYGARVVNFTWCDDFAAARNAAIDAATSDWVLMLDADEGLVAESGPLLRKLIAKPPAGLHVYMVQMENQLHDDTAEVSSDYVPRLFPRRPDIRFFYRIHEQPLFAPHRDATNMVESPIRVRHLGYTPELMQARSKDERNLKLLLEELEQEPDSLRAQYFLIRHHDAMQRYPQVVECAQRFLADARQVKQRYLVDVYRMYVTALAGLARFDDLERVVADAQPLGVLPAEAWNVLGFVARQRGQLEDAARQFEVALRPDLPRSLSWSPGVGGWRTRTLLAEVYVQLGRPAQALEQLRLAYAETPESRRFECAMAIAELELRIGSPTSPLLAAVCGGEWQAAYDLAIKLGLSDERSQAEVLIAAGGLADEGAPDAALDLLARILDANNSSKRVYWLLVRVLTDLGKYDDAASAAELLRVMEHGEGLAAAA